MITARLALRRRNRLNRVRDDRHPSRRPRRRLWESRRLHLTLDRLAREGACSRMRWSRFLKLGLARQLVHGPVPLRARHAITIRRGSTPRCPPATLLRRQGYSTAAFVGAYPVSRSSGLDQGFLVTTIPLAKARTRPRTTLTERPAGQVVDAARAAEESGGPFLRLDPSFDPRAAPSARALRQRFAKNPYDGEIAYADAARTPGPVADAQGLRQSTPLVVVGPRGSLGEHGRTTPVFLYDSTLKVPVIVLAGRLALAAGSRVRCDTDFVATLLDLLAFPAETSGASADAVRSGGRIPDNECTRSHLRPAPLRLGAPAALRGEGWWSMPRARALPSGQRSRRAPEPDGDPAKVATAMVAVLVVRQGENRRRGRALDPAAEELAALPVGRVLRAGLGRPQGQDPRLPGVPEGRCRCPASLPRPRRGRASASDAPGSSGHDRIGPGPREPILQRRIHPGSGPVDKKLAEAVPISVRRSSCADLDPGLRPSRPGLRGREACPAAAAIDRGLVRAPANSQLLQAKGSLQLRQGDYAGARRTLEKARDRDPRSALVRVDLATVYRSQGELATGKVEADEAVRLAPKLPEAHELRARTR
jgi:hypothetical protein